MATRKFTRDFVKKCKAVTAKRPRTVIDHILKHGYITTEDLKQKYGYNHPPRAVRDVKEHGIPIEMFRVTGSDGRKIGAYRFGDPSRARFSKLSGRTVLAKELKEKLIYLHGSKCAIYLEEFNQKNLQIDHRIPFEVAGDNDNSMDDPSAYMLLCGSANRAKSWSCEHCENWLNLKDKDICRKCYWAFPENYTHVAMLEIRRLDILWQRKEVAEYDKLKQQSISAKQLLPDFVKKIMKKHLEKS